MKTFDNIREISEFIAVYFEAKRHLTKMIRISGGYLHYDSNHTNALASEIDSYLARDIRVMLVARQAALCEKLLGDLSSEVVVAEEMADIKRIREQASES